LSEKFHLQSRLQLTEIYHFKCEFQLYRNITDVYECRGRQVAWHDTHTHQATHWNLT